MGREKREAGRGQKKNLRKKWKKRTNGRRNQVRRNGKGRRNIRKPGRKPRRGKNGKKRPNRPNGPKVPRGGPRQNDECAQKTACMTGVSSSGNQQYTYSLMGLASTSAWFGNQARNHYRMATRAMSFHDRLTKKMDKAGNFKNTLERLTEVLGGDAAALKCNGATLAADDEINGVMETLTTCEADIETSCQATLTPDQEAALEKCKTNTEIFRNNYIEAFAPKKKLDGAAVCAKINEGDLTAQVGGLKTDCQPVKDMETEQKAKWKMCDAAFKKCAGAQKKVFDITRRCRGRTARQGCPGPVVPESKEEAQAQAKALDGIVKAWGPAKAALDAALKRPEARQAPTEDGEGCTALMEGIQETLDAAIEAAEDPLQGVLDLANSDSIGEGLDALAKRDVAADVSSCSEDTLEMIRDAYEELEEWMDGAIEQLEVLIEFFGEELDLDFGDEDDEDDEDDDNDDDYDDDEDDDDEDDDDEDDDDEDDDDEDETTTMSPDDDTTTTAEPAPTTEPPITTEPATTTEPPTTTEPATTTEPPTTTTTMATTTTSTMSTAVGS